MHASLLIRNLWYQWILPVSFKNFKKCYITILVAFTCNAKSFAFAVLFFFFPFSLSLFFLDRLSKFFHWLLMICYSRSVTKIEPFWLDTRKKVGVTNVFKDVTCDAYDPCDTMYFTLFTVTSIHSILQITKIRNSETRRKVTQNIQLFKTQKTEKSTW